MLKRRLLAVVGSAMLFSILWQCAWAIGQFISDEQKALADKETVSRIEYGKGVPVYHSSKLGLEATRSSLKARLGDKVTYKVRVKSPVKFITIFVNGEKKKTCFAQMCKYESQPIEEQPVFAAIAVDSHGAYATTGDVSNEAVINVANAIRVDTDDDGLPDVWDNCPQISNEGQSDLDDDGVGDDCDACCPACNEPLFTVEYCCLPRYNYNTSACSEDIQIGPEYYWEVIYDRISNDGCGCIDYDGTDEFTRSLVRTELQQDRDCSRSGLTGEYICDPDKSTCMRSHDRCTDENTVREATCGPDGLKFIDIDCPAENPVCENGRCACPDTDGGENYYQQGTLLGQPDECVDDTRLREFHCDRDHMDNLIASSKIIDCPYGCSAGACVCEDSDGGRVIEISGRMGTKKDECTSARFLDEVWPRVLSGPGATCEIVTSNIKCPGLCDADACLPVSCEDRVQNQYEEGIDCGGPCPLPCDISSLSESELPTRFFWGDWRGRSWITPIDDQGTCGACASFAAVAVTESKALIEHTDGWVPEEFFTPPQTEILLIPPDLSEQVLISGCTSAWSDCTGGTVSDALSGIRDDGIVDEACMKWTSGDCLDADGNCVDACGWAGNCSNPRSCPDVCDDGAVWSTHLWKIAEHSKISGTNTVSKVKKALLDNGPLATCITDWGHCLALVGWDDESELAMCRDGCWILKNSWGIKPARSLSSEDPGGSGDRYDYDNVWLDAFGFAYIPYYDHDYSKGVRKGVRWPTSVNPPASWP